MHESVFSYNLSRPYPYRWFTWVVFFGGVVATFVFSLINLAADGYDIVLVYTTNATEIESVNRTAWYQNRPWSLASKIAPNCSAQMINVGETYYTNNYGFPYTVNKILSHSGNQSTSVATLAYKNAQLHDCTVDSLFAEPNMFEDGYIIVQATVNCSIGFANTFATLSLKTAFTIDFEVDSNPLIPPTNVIPDFLSLNAQIQPSLAWGHAWMQTYMSMLYYQVNGMNLTATSTLIWIFFPGLNFGFTLESNAQISTSYSVSGNVTAAEWSFATITNMLDSDMISYGHGSAGLKSNLSDPFYWVGIYYNGLGKSVYWTILADLGQHTANILGDPQKLMEYYHDVNEYKSYGWTSLIDDFGIDLGTKFDRSNISFNDTASFYHLADTGIPHIDPAVFAQQYLCQVPRRKEAGSLIITIVVADLVFLQALWKILNWVTTMMLERRHPHAKHCIGCEEAMKRNEVDVEMHETSRHGIVNYGADDTHQHEGEASRLVNSVDRSNNTSVAEQTKDPSVPLLRPVLDEPEQ